MHRCELENLMEDRGLRKTRQRHRLLELIGERRAWSVAELHHRLKAADLSTVYRNVQELLKKGVLSEVRLRGAEVRYEPAGLGHHAHLICGRCRRAECVPCPVDLRSEHHLELNGLCSACR